MRLCPNCGLQTGDEARFCINCSAVLPEISASPVALPLKDLRTVMFLAGAVGIVFMGVGHFYVYRIPRGVAFFTLGTATGLIFVVAVLGGFFAASIEIAGLVGVARLALWIWQTRDAYLLTKAYNESLKNAARTS